MLQVVRVSLACVLTATLSVVTQAQDAAKPQFEFEKIRIEAPRADEAKLPAVDLAKAIDYLEQGTHAWYGARKCIACHTPGIYLTIRPAMTPQLGKPTEAVRQAFVETHNRLVEQQKSDRSVLKKGTRPAELIYIAAGLAEWDAHVSKSLSDDTKATLATVFSVQVEGGSWGSLNCWPPYESDAYHLATVAAMAVATAPGYADYAAKDVKLADSVKKLQAYLKTTPPPHDYGGVLLLWASARMPELLTAEKKHELIDMLAKHQRIDGGWSIRTFAAPEAWGSGNRAAKLKSEPEFVEPPSDGHQTGLAIMVLREHGVPISDARIQRGLQWLQTNQRASGRWWTRSLNTDSYHFITYSGTAFPLRALSLCNALPELPKQIARQ